MTGYLGMGEGLLVLLLVLLVLRFVFRLAMKVLFGVLLAGLMCLLWATGVLGRLFS